MYFCHTILLFMTCTSSVVFLAAQSTLSTNATVCRTQYGGASGQLLSTAWTTNSGSITITRTTWITPTSTIPPIVTEFVPVTVSVDTTITASTITSTTGITDTMILPTTEIAPTTTLTSTVTIDATTTTTITTNYPYVTPVQDTLPGAMAKKRSINRYQRRQSLSSSSADSSIPRVVYCLVVQRVVVIVTFTRTASPTTVSTTPSTTTLIQSTIETNIVTLPASTILVTTTSTTTLISTITEVPLTVVLTTRTSTFTSTSFIQTQTTYPQCSPSNQAGHVNSGSIISYFPPGSRSSGLVISNIPAPSPEECCIACLKYPSCGASFFEYKTSRCFFLQPEIPPGPVPGPCGVGEAEGPIKFTVGVREVLRPGDYTYSVSNGKCGLYIGVEPR